MVKMATNLPGRNSEPIRHTHTTNENGERWEHLAETCPYTHRSLGVCLRTLTPTAVAWKSSWEGVLCGMLGRSRPFNVFEQSARIKARFPWDRPACTQEGSRVDAAFARRWGTTLAPLPKTSPSRAPDHPLSLSRSSAHDWTRVMASVDPPNHKKKYVRHFKSRVKPWRNLCYHAPEGSWKEGVGCNVITPSGRESEIARRFPKRLGNAKKTSIVLGL